MTNQKCEEHIDERLTDRLDDLKKLLALYHEDTEAFDYDLGSLHGYGLCADYVEPGTFGSEQTEGYMRYQLSWGGPSDEFRYYVGWEGTPLRIFYHYMDWFDGAERELAGENKTLLMNIWEALYFEGVLPQK